MSYHIPIIKHTHTLTHIHVHIHTHFIFKLYLSMYNFTVIMTALNITPEKRDFTGYTKTGFSFYFKYIYV